MEPVISKYAILTHTTELREHISFEVVGLNDDDDSEAPVRLTRVAGTLLKVFQTKTAGSSTSTVQILDFVNKVAHYDNLYECPHSHLCKVSEDLWPYVISIAEPERRLRFVQNRALRQSIYIQPNELVCVMGELFGHKGVRYDCIVRYIGPVQELYPVGYFFGLELLHLDNGLSPQSENIPYASKYMQCDPSLAIFTTADWVALLPNDARKKFSPLDLLTDTLEKVRTAASCLSSGSPTSSASSRQYAYTLPRQPSTKKAKKPGAKKPKTATAQFYGAAPPSPASSAVNAPVEELASEPSGSPPPPFVVASDAMERRKTATASSDGANAPALIVLENDDFKKSIENYEKSLEQRQHSVAISTSNASSQTAMPAGILKHRFSVNAAGGSAAPNSSSQTATPAATTTAKPLTILSLEDRDIVVIDKADIRDATKNEGSVIVVNMQRPHARQQDVDLVELLGSDWPHTAGDAATTILNKRTSMAEPGGGGGSSNSSVSSLSQRTADRNKSPNLLLHIANSSSSSNNNNSNNNTLTRKTLERKRTGSVTSTSTNTQVTNCGETSGAEASTSSSNQLNNAAAASAAILDDEEEVCSPLQEVPHSSEGLGIGSMVELRLPQAFEDIYGVIRWIGVPPNAKHVLVGVELEEDHSDKQLVTTNGAFNGVALFKCPEGRALFVLPKCCVRDKRFLDVDHHSVSGVGARAINGAKMNGNAAAAATAAAAAPADDTNMFGHVECPSVPGAVAPLDHFNLSELDKICGKFKGIQGHHNSCYLDATLFAMFTFTSVFDSLLFRPADADDIAHYTEVQKVLREEIVNPLRKNVFVRADRVMKLRQLLDKLSSVSGLTSEEKDPEEFLHSLLAQIMRVEPFLKLNSGQDAYFYQLFVEKDERLSFPTVQQLFEQSFHSSDIKLKEVPSCLIIQMPRFGKNYKMYPRILPSQVLDVTDIIDDSPRQCTVCGKLAEYECRDCFGGLQGAVGLESTAFCRQCLETVHMHAKRANHRSKPLSVPQDFRMMAEHMSSVPRLYMDLFAVVCIETSHYVAFVKAGSAVVAPWCFFDSMADRKGEQNGYNIPEMITVPDLPQWLSEDGARLVNETSTNDKMLPEHAKRLFCDAYMCMYRSTDVMMYR